MSKVFNEIYSKLYYYFSIRNFQIVEALIFFSNWDWKEEDDWLIFFRIYFKNGNREEEDEEEKDFFFFIWWLFESCYSEIEKKKEVDWVENDKRDDDVDYFKLVKVKYVCF